MKNSRIFLSKYKLAHCSVCGILYAEVIAMQIREVSENVILIKEENRILDEYLELIE